MEKANGKDEARRPLRCRTLFFLFLGEHKSSEHIETEGNHVLLGTDKNKFAVTPRMNRQPTTKGRDSENLTERDALKAAIIINCR